MTDPNTNATEYIGMASMDENRNVILDLRATDGAGAVGVGRLVYGPAHAQYEMLLEHVGGLEPGEQKPVTPFPEDD